MNELATLSIAGATAQETAPDSVPAGQRTLSVADDANIRSVSDPRVTRGSSTASGSPRTARTSTRDTWPGTENT
jgi:hypothetical protein